MKVTVLGAGAWGTALAAHLARRHDVVLWARDAGLVSAMRADRENRSYLPGCALPAGLRVEADLARALRDGAAADLAVVATPVAGLRGLLGTLSAQSLCPERFVWLCKGFEADTMLLPHQVVAQVLPGHRGNGALSGPSFAREVAQHLPAALTAASRDADCRAVTVRAFHHESIRIYTSDDITGVEVGGAVKNVLAIAAGIADGLGLGLNARAALLTRGLAEMSRLGVALGARADTFIGLTGVGDLILTATGDLSRNRRVGLQLAEGAPLDTILARLGHVAEGVLCARAVHALAREHGVDMPITAAVCRVLFDGADARGAVATLLGRDAKPER
ncbi:NAD(P)H-dependent glycerol-3-phosphate dehydrogenase [Chitinasiproducens palmae]|uniref:Glycerol-3-phosphate dehydrogenase [NAD(P)+] n=1 Tax=Chitinasiproducens palmae TaxID=1770053 RepID=A0A1H2PNL9_9BURK|nr:NAD(P)H-dependent glycerol-3-phosphate dehydrogenase [Chitinasiproducens palmae]SDV48248.1 glycerol-3-phosphate dehydrogenase (NAD(P)+) [Chitinasiproducens palmae]